MATNATLVLHQLTLVSVNDERGRSPYIWPALLWIDDDTLQTDELVGVIGPVLEHARVVLEDEMRAGDRASIPFPLGTLGVTLEEETNIRHLILVVALLERHETPDVAMWAGCRTFTTELRAAVADRLQRLVNEVERPQAIEEIKAQVANAVSAATFHALTSWEKARVLLGTLTLDASVGSDHVYFADTTPRDITLTVAGDSYSYEIHGSLQVQTPPIDLCQAQVDAVKAAQAVVDGIHGQIQVLQSHLHHATPAQKPAIVAQIAQLGAQLSVAQEDLDDARRTLEACRDRWKQRAGLRQAVTTAPTVTL